MGSPVVWSSAAYHGDRLGGTMITCDVWRWQQKFLRFGKDTDLPPNVFVRLCSLYMPSILLWHLFSKAWIRLSRSAVSVQLSHPQSSTDKTSDLKSIIFVGKLMACFSTVLPAWSWLSVLAPVCYLLPLLMFRLWFVWSVSIWTGPLLRAFVRSSVCW